MLRRLPLFPLIILSGLLSGGPQDGVFVEKPYVQLGNAPDASAKEQLRILWHAPDRDARWAVEYKAVDAKDWIKADLHTPKHVVSGVVDPHRVYAATLHNLVPGARYAYRVLLDGNPVFESSVAARKSAAMPYRFAVFGDIAQGTPAQRKVAYQTYQAKPDFVAIAGDIVYGRGLISEYREKYFPVYNADEATPAAGAPLIRSTLFIAAPGNHDVGGADLAKNPDGLAYFFYWAQPLNGPLKEPRNLNAPQAAGASAQLRRFNRAAGEQFPRMASFSFEYGNSHWTVLDSNRYANWYSPEMLEWLKKDLAAAQSAKWRFVIFHHPGFNSSKAHFKDQWMRLLAPVFEESHVDIVFGGHVHNYQRTFPLRFQPAGKSQWRGEVDGSFTLDKAFDGTANTRPNGVIYLVTGAGGASLYNPEQEGDPATWQEFTTRFKSNINSFTLADVDGATLSIRQVDANGKEIDKYTITK